VNGGMYFDVSTPLGGYELSGIGRRKGEEGFREYMELKSIGIRPVTSRPHGGSPPRGGRTNPGGIRKDRGQGNGQAHHL